MQPYKSTIELSELNDAVLPNLKDFIEYLLDVGLIQGEKIVIPAADVTLASKVGSGRVFYINHGNIKGIYEDEAILRDSADKRQSSIVWLVKLGAIQVTDFNKSVPLESREVSVHLLVSNLKNLYEKIAQRIDYNEKEKKKQVKKKDKIRYREGRLWLGSKSFEVTGLEECISKEVFGKTNKNEFYLSEMITKYTGHAFEPLDSKKEMKAFRSAAYRVRKKIKDKFGKNILAISKDHNIQIITVWRDR